MSKRGIKISDVVAITSTVRRRVTEDRVSVSIPTYGFPHSIVKTSKVKKGQPIEMIGHVIQRDRKHFSINHGPISCKKLMKATSRRNTFQTFHHLTTAL